MLEFSSREASLQACGVGGLPGARTMKTFCRRTTDGDLVMLLSLVSIYYLILDYASSSCSPSSPGSWRPENSSSAILRISILRTADCVLSSGMGSLKFSTEIYHHLKKKRKKNIPLYLDATMFYVRDIGWQVQTLYLFGTMRHWMGGHGWVLSRQPLGGMNESAHLMSIRQLRDGTLLLGVLAALPWRSLFFTYMLYLVCFWMPRSGLHNYPSLCCIACPCVA